MDETIFTDDDERNLLTAGNRMWQVEGTVLLCAHVAETTRTKGNHNGNPVEDGSRTEGGKG